MFNKAMLLASGGGASSNTSNTTGEFTLTSGYHEDNPYSDGIFIDKFWGYGVEGDDPYVNENFGAVSPTPVCLFDQAMCSLGYVENNSMGWYGMRVHFGYSETTPWTQKIIVYCGVGEAMVLDQMYLGLYGGDLTGGDTPPRMYNALVTPLVYGQDLEWEIRAFEEDAKLDSYPVFVNIDDAVGVQHPLAVKATIARTDGSYFEQEIEFTTDENGRGVITAPGLHCFEGLPLVSPYTWSISGSVVSNNMQVFQHEFDSFPFSKARPLELVMEDYQGGQSGGGLN